MSTPVVTDKWAGNFDCDFCRRKRLMGDEFSKKALEKYRKQGGKLKCKQCVQKVEEEERLRAAAKSAAAGGDDKKQDQSQEKRKCQSCQETLEFSAFNRNQWNKGEGKSRCRQCVEKAVAAEADQQSNAKQAKLAAARERVAQAQSKGNAQEILKAESELSALEAEQVTGLKPVKMGRGGGRGRGGRGRGRR